jgi:hypothetical protein
MLRNMLNQACNACVPIFPAADPGPQVTDAGTMALAGSSSPQRQPCSR